jgi:hypothetical protein
MRKPVKLFMTILGFGLVVHLFLSFFKISDTFENEVAKTVVPASKLCGSPIFV